MRRLVPLLALVLVVAGAAAAGCGGDDDTTPTGGVALEEAKAAYLPLCEDLIETGGDLGTALRDADQRTDAELASQDIGRIADAAAAHDGPAARAATERLVEHSETIRTARGALDATFGIEEEEDEGAATAGTATAPAATALERG